MFFKVASGTISLGGCGSAAGSTFTTAEIYPYVIKTLGCAPKELPLAMLRYDLSKLRAKGLIAKLSRSRRYQLLACGCSVCLVFLKLFERIYAPLAAVSSAR